MQEQFSPDTLSPLSQGRYEISREEAKLLAENHIIFEDETLSFPLLNAVYNAADVYVSPYTGN